jgi:argininosuccinate synthase
MVEIKKDSLENENLERVLHSSSNQTGSQKPLNEDKKPEVSKDMEIGFHQGTLNTLVNERNELVKMIQQIEQIMRAHMKRLEELGVKISEKK